MKVDNSFFENRSVQDIAGLDNLRKAALSKDEGALREAAKQFESIFMQMLIKSMRDVNAVFETDSPMNNQYTKNYRDMYDQQLSSELSSNGALGLADIIVKQLGGDNGNYKNAAHLKPLSVQPLDMTTKPSLDGKANEVKTQPDYLVPKRPIAAKADTSAINSLSSPNFSDPADFVQQLLPIVNKIAGALSVNPMTLVAQAALETGWGQKIMSKSDGNSSFNLFGIKADGRWQGESATISTIEYRDGIAARERASFRAYDSLESSVEDYIALISTNPRYQEAAAAQDAAEYTKALQYAGYATDPNYAEKVMAVLASPAFKEAHKLQR